MDSNNTCNFLDHSSSKVPIHSTHYCHTCELRLCSNCLLIHNSNPDYFSHKIEKINENQNKWKQKLNELEKNKPIINLNNKEGKEIINSKKYTYGENLNVLNNMFRNMVFDWYKIFNEFDNIKKNIDTKMEKNENNINYNEIKKKVCDIYKNIIKKQNEINDLKSTGINLQNYNQLNDLLKIYRNLTICSNVNNFCIIDKIVNNKEKNINRLEKISTNKSYNDINNIIKKIDITKNKELESIQKRKIFVVNNAGQKEVEEKNGRKKINNLSESPKNKLNFKNILNLSIISNNNTNINDYLNKKTKRERKKKECHLCDCCSNDAHKKKKLENNIINNNMRENEEMKKKELNKENINEKEKEIKGNCELYFFNFRFDLDNKLSIVLFEYINKERKCKCFYRDKIIFKQKFPNWENFPFLQSKIININNNAFIIGGKSNWNIEEGNNLVLRINYVNNNNEKNQFGEIICTPLINTKFSHHSHNLIYSEKYNTIFVLSGHEQYRCEFGTLDKEKKAIKEWKEFNHIRAPRKNAICFLLNEQYIFLIGGQEQNSFNYDVFDISSIFENDKPLIWKTYNFTINQFNKQIFGIQNPGIIYSSNNIFILGCNKDKENINWKIEFTNDTDDKNIDNYKRITNISIFENNIFEEIERTFYFYGQPLFIGYSNIFLNIDIFGGPILLPKSIFEELNE